MTTAASSPASTLNYCWTSTETILKAQTVHTLRLMDYLCISMYQHSNGVLCPYSQSFLAVLLKYKPKRLCFFFFFVSSMLWILPWINSEQQINKQNLWCIHFKTIARYDQRNSCSTSLQYESKRMQRGITSEWECSDSKYHICPTQLKGLWVQMWVCKIRQSATAAVITWGMKDVGRGGQGRLEMNDLEYAGPKKWKTWIMQDVESAPPLMATVGQQVG